MKNLGVYFDVFLTAETQVYAISSANYYHICNIDHIKQYITMDAYKTLAHALVTS